MIGTGCAFLGFLYGLYTIIKKLVNPLVPIGFSSLMSAIMFIGGMLMLMVGLVGEYIGLSLIHIFAASAYYQSHPENLFLADVYSTVKFSEKMFRDGECVLGNYDQTNKKVRFVPRQNR